MLNLALGFVSCFLVTFLIVRYAGLCGNLAFDHDLKSVQKMHSAPVPRVGGVAIVGAVGITFGIGALFGTNPRAEPFLLLLCATPVFLGGVIEDLTKRVSPAVRLLCAACSALAGACLLHAIIGRVDLPLIDHALIFTPIAIGLTLLTISGLTNAVNLIDGFNGLAAGVAILVFGSISYVSHQVEDWMVLAVSLTMIGTILGFLIWNYPAASIFLGDGGAYFIGFVMAELVVILIARHPNVSAWYAAVVTIYPTFETVFSIYRRRLVRNRPAGEPDGVHLHSLIYKRLVRRGLASSSTRVRSRRNAKVSPYLWTLSMISIVPATLFWQLPIVLFFAAAVFAVIYVWLYASIVKFRTPRWMISYITREVESETVEQTRH
jgi:UDP-N-acetylmuramyl pentapeptide phosphotransferase/UDP-N-acetylglucosamine-1-phosphate transferase